MCWATRPDPGTRPAVPWSGSCPNALTWWALQSRVYLSMTVASAAETRTKKNIFSCCHRESSGAASAWERENWEDLPANLHSYPLLQCKNINSINVKPVLFTWLCMTELVETTSKTVLLKSLQSDNELTHKFKLNFPAEPIVSSTRYMLLLYWYLISKLLNIMLFQSRHVHHE